MPSSQTIDTLNYRLGLVEKQIVIMKELSKEYDEYVTKRFSEYNCENADLQIRVQELEGKVAYLEKYGNQR